MYNPTVPFRSRLDYQRRAKAAREDRDISLKMVAEETGISLATLKRFKAETVQTATLTTLEPLLRYFGLTRLDDLVEYAPAPEQAGAQHPDRTSDPKGEYRPTSTTSSPGTGQE